MTIVAYGYGISPGGAGGGDTIVVGREATVSTSPIAATVSTPSVAVTVNDGNEVLAEVDQS